jgi:hypothetical protein
VSSPGDPTPTIVAAAFDPAVSAVEYRALAQCAFSYLEPHQRRAIPWDMLGDSLGVDEGTARHLVASLARHGYIERSGERFRALLTPLRAFDR